MLLLDSFFFFKYSASSEIYSLSLHDALPICVEPNELALILVGDRPGFSVASTRLQKALVTLPSRGQLDRKSTRLNSSHRCISYAVFCLKKKKQLYYTQ